MRRSSVGILLHCSRRIWSFHFIHPFQLVNTSKMKFVNFSVVALLTICGHGSSLGIGELHLRYNNSPYSPLGLYSSRKLSLNLISFSTSDTFIEGSSSVLHVISPPAGANAAGMIIISNTFSECQSNGATTVRMLKGDPRVKLVCQTLLLVEPK